MSWNINSRLKLETTNYETMKEFVIIMMIIFSCIIDVNSQSDSFFSYHQEYRNDKDSEWEELIMLPKTHGLDYNYPASDAPLGPGSIILVGMGICYGLSRKCKLSKIGDNTNL